MSKLYSAGNTGIGVKSDCMVSYTPSQASLTIHIKSKVMPMFGKSILALAEKMMAFFDITTGELYIDDKGSLEYVLAARIEATIKQAFDTKKEYLLEINPENTNETQKDAFRFSRLYLPGNTPKLSLNAGVHKPNGLILDLEDAVAPNKKEEARFVVRNALRSMFFYGAERMVRINQGEKGLDDLEYLVPHGVNLILVPKVEGADRINEVNLRIASIQKRIGSIANIWLMPIIESAKGTLKAYEIASAENVVALAIGLEDYTADIGVARTKEATESFFARSMLVNAAKAAGIQAIDSVFSDVSDMEALAQNVKNSKAFNKLQTYSRTSFSAAVPFNLSQLNPK